MTRTFRFALVDAPFGLAVPPFRSLRDWTDRARRAEDLGFDTLLVPDGPKRFSAFSTLTAAAVVTDRIRLGTFLTSVPFWSPGAIAWEAATLDQLSGGRFELGLGAGHPANAAGAARFGTPYGTPRERVRRVADVISAVNRLEDAAVQALQRPRPPILVGGAGERLLSLAAREADIIHIDVDTEQTLAEKVDIIRIAAGQRFDAIELSIGVFHVGDGEEPSWLANYGIQPSATHLSVIRAGTDGAVETLQRWREEYGISYVNFASATATTAEPVIRRLAGT